MAEGNVVTRAFKRIAAGYKSLPGIVVRAIVATLLGTGDLVSDVYTTVSLFSLSHLGPAYAMVAMICASMAAQVRAVYALYLGVGRRAWLAGACGLICGSAGATCRHHDQAPRQAGRAERAFLGADLPPARRRDMAAGTRYGA